MKKIFAKPFFWFKFILSIYQCAINGEHKNVVELLLENQINPNYCDSLEDPPIHYAIKKYGTDRQEKILNIIKILLENGSNPFLY